MKAIRQDKKLPLPDPLAPPAAPAPQYTAGAPVPVDPGRPRKEP